MTLARDDIDTLSAALRQRRMALQAALWERLHPAGGARLVDEGASAGALGDAALAGLRHDLVDLGLVEAALARVAAGSYADCSACGAPIGAGRLHAQPTASLCLACQRQDGRARQGG